MKCKYMGRRGGCDHGCTPEWFKCHSFFSGKWCEYSDEAKCHRGWHYRNAQDYKNRDKKRCRHIAISSEDSDEEQRAKKPRELASSREPSSSQGPQSSKAFAVSLEKVRWHTHIANLAMDINTFDDKSVEDIENAYESIHNRMSREEAPAEQLLRISESFHALIKKRAGCD